MRVPQLKQSWCGCTLQTGSKILGWYYLVNAAIVGIGMSVDWHIRKENTNIVYGSLAVMVGAIVHFTMAVCLLYGAYYRLPRPIRVWLVYTAITSTSLIAIFFLSGYLFSKGVIGVGMVILFVGLIAVALQWYFFLVVYSFYRELKYEPQNISVNDATSTTCLT